MSIVTTAISILLGLMVLLIACARVGAWLIEKKHPPAGVFVSINGGCVHHVHVPAGPDADLPSLVFIHGASGNLLDQLVPLRPLLEGRSEMLFVDRPGHGWSERGAANGDPSAQAATLVALMDHYNIKDAVIVGHSFGGAVAATLAVEHPERVRGLVFLSPATHPWPGATTSWYYDLAARPVVGRLFVETFAWLGGSAQIETASQGVFAPNRKPDSYVDDAAIRLVLRPRTFFYNALDVAGLYAHVVRLSQRYAEIVAPTVIVSGNRDTVVYEEIHAWGLARDIPGAQLVWVDNLGHKPDWVAPDLVVAAIEKVAGQPADLAAAVRVVEARIAGDAFGPIEPRADTPQLTPAT